MPAPVASGWSGRRAGLAPAGKAPPCHGARGDAVIEALLREIRTRMEPIGVSVLEARISHLAYSSEIAGAMLRKQAASAVVAARRMVVQGAVSIVEDALSELDKKNSLTPSIRNVRPP